MQISNGRKAFYITVSIFVAFIIWFYVNNDTDVEISVSDISVEFINADAALASKGFVLVNAEERPTVDLVLGMPRSMVYSFDVSRVRAIADLGSVSSSGTQTVNYTIITPSNINRSLISVRYPAVQTVSVRIGELFRRNDIEVRCKLVGNVADGYVAGGVQLLPNTLEIWGQQSDVLSVSYAQVTLNIENARSTIVELLSYELYDYNGNLIENSNIHSSSDTIQVTMPVISATDVPLAVDFEEQPGVRLSSFDYSFDVESVTLSGDAKILSEVNKIVLGRVVLADITGEKTFTYDIPIPDGLSNLSGVYTATLTVKNRGITTKDINVTSFDYANFDVEGRAVEVVTSSLGVTLRGMYDTLDAIEDESVTAVADLSGVNDASGTYTVPAYIRIDGDPDVGTVQSYQLTVRIVSKTETGSETEGEGETGEAEGEGEGTEQGEAQGETEEGTQG